MLYVVFFVQSMLGPEPIWPHLRGLLFRWQTFIAGCLALIAGGGTILATRNAANRQVRAADRQVRAAWSQTEAASRQTEAMWTMERRRIAREAYAFFEMIDAAMTAVLDDVTAARGMAAAIQQDGGSSNAAYAARKRIKKAGFSELRSACLRYGGQLVTLAFLRLDKEIDDFASKVFTIPTAMEPRPVGDHDDLHKQLDIIELQAKGLSEEVGPAKKRCLDLLRTMPGPDFP